MDPNNAGLNTSGKGRGNMGINFDQGSGAGASGGGGVVSSSGGGSRSDSVMRTGKGGSGRDGGGDSSKGASGDSSKGGGEGRSATARADRDAASKGASSDAPASQPRGEGVARDGASRGDTVARGESERGAAGRAEDSGPGARASAGDSGRSAGPSAWSLASEGSGAPADPARLRGRGDAPRSPPTTGSVPLPLQAGGGVVALRPGDRLLPLASFDRGAASQSQIASEMTGAFILRAATRVGPALAGSTGRPPPRPLPRWRGERVLPAVVVVQPAVATDRGILGEAIAQYHQSGAR
jgi:hypothetical protein